MANKEANVTEYNSQGLAFEEVNPYSVENGELVKKKEVKGATCEKLHRTLGAQTVKITSFFSNVRDRGGILS